MEVSWNPAKISISSPGLNQALLEMQTARAKVSKTLFNEIAAKNHASYYSDLPLKIQRGLLECPFAVESESDLRINEIFITALTPFKKLFEPAVEGPYLPVADLFELMPELHIEERVNSSLIRRMTGAVVGLFRGCISEPKEN